jgi:cell division protein FtsI/penicillin-binding protein 2
MTMKLNFNLVLLVVFLSIISLPGTKACRTASHESEPAPAGCADAIRKQAVCEAANRYALQLIREGNLQAVSVMQDVKTGALVAFVASDPSVVNVTAPLLPLSTVKLMVAASWWDHGLPDDPKLVDAPQMSVSEMLARGNDNVGRRLASMLRASIGTEGVLKDLKAYGFAAQTDTSPRFDSSFWAELHKPWQAALMPAGSYHLLSERTSTKDWEDVLSIGESGFTVTPLHLSRFLQAVGNDGVMLEPIARAEQGEGDKSKQRSTRVMNSNTALKLQAGMRGAVQRGTATSIAHALEDTGWQMGGKTGSGPNKVGPESDGWFAGLVFDEQNHARFTVATFVKHGGPGGGNAARISAALAGFLIRGDKRAQ